VHKTKKKVYIYIYILQALAMAIRRTAALLFQSLSCYMFTLYAKLKERKKTQKKKDKKSCSSGGDTIYIYMYFFFFPSLLQLCFLNQGSSTVCSYHPPRDISEADQQPCHQWKPLPWLASPEDLSW
jgi:hypothetical protein